MGASLHGARARSQRGTLYRRLQQYAAGFSARVDAGTGSALARCIEGAFDTFIHRGVLAMASGGCAAGTAADGHHRADEMLPSHIRDRVVDVPALEPSLKRVRPQEGGAHPFKRSTAAMG